MTNVSFVVPAHNEEKYILSTIENLLEFIEGTDSEIIIVEDGSEDRTPEICDELDNEWDQVRHYHNEDKLGKGKAIEVGGNLAKQEIIFFLDADGSSDNESIKNIIKEIRNSEIDIVIGSRKLSSNVDRELLREFMSDSYNELVQLILRTGIKDHQCGYKAFKDKVFQNIVQETRSTGFFWDTEAIFLAKKMGFNLKEIPITWEERGDSSVDFRNTVPELLKELIKLKIRDIKGEFKGL